MTADQFRLVWKSKAAEVAFAPTTRAQALADFDKQVTGDPAVRSGLVHLRVLRESDYQQRPGT